MNQSSMKRLMMAFAVALAISVAWSGKFRHKLSRSPALQD